MAMVLVLHGLGGVGFPDDRRLAAEPLLLPAMTWLHAVALVAVNVFILISGWFGIRPTRRGLCKYLFQSVFAWLVAYGVLLAAGVVGFSGKGLAECFYMGKAGWFVKSYLLLFLFSPVLNAFTQTASERSQRFVLLGFFTFQSLAGWWWDASGDIHRGFSVVSFFGLYLLAHYVRTFWSARLDQVPTWGFWLLFLGLSVLNCWEKNVPYSSPLLVAQSLCLLLAFSRWHFTARAVNALASGCFMVYLLHQYPPLGRYFSDTCALLFHDRALGEGSWLLVVFLAAVYAGSLLFDRLRLLCWQGLCRLFPSL